MVHGACRTLASWGSAVRAATVPSCRRLRLCCCEQVNEFGQCPAQLFAEPHPLRCAAPPWAPQALQGALQLLARVKAALIWLTIAARLPQHC